MGNSDLIYWWKRLNSREQFNRANFSTSDICKVRDVRPVDCLDEFFGVGRDDDASRGGLGGLHNVAGGLDFFGALGLGGGREGTGFGGSRPWIIKIRC